MRLKIFLTLFTVGIFATTVSLPVFAASSAEIKTRIFVGDGILPTPTPTPTPTATPTATPTVTATPEVPVIVATSTNSYGSQLLMVYDFQVLWATTTGSRALSVSFKTNMPALVQIPYGLDSDLALGTLQGVEYRVDHSYLIGMLPFGEKYYLSVRLKTLNGVSWYLKTVTIDGLLPFRRPPIDALDFKIEEKNGAVAASWRNPASPNFSYIYLVRSDKFYPYDLSYGKPLYKGEREEYLDRDLIAGTKYYYALFACNRERVCSPGAYASLVFGGGDRTVIPRFGTLAEKGERITVAARDPFILRAKKSADDRTVRIYLARIYSGSDLVSVRQLTKNEAGDWQTSKLSLGTPGTYSYFIERYRLAETEAEKVIWGEIAVVGSPIAFSWRNVLVQILFLSLVALFFWLVHRHKKYYNSNNVKF